MGISLSGLTESSTGNLTISAGSGNDILIGNGSTQLFVDGGTDTLGVGGTAVTGSRLNIETGAVALDFITSTGTAFNVVADTVNDTSGSATLAIVPTVQVGVMTYTSSNAMTYTDTASVYIAGIPVASTNVTFTNPAYALWVDSGAVRFDDRTFWIGGIAYEFPANNGNASEFLQTDGSGNLVWSSVASASVSTTVTVTDNEATNESNLVTFVAGAATATGNHGLEMDGDFTYSPNTGTVAATNFSGNLTGTLQTAAQGTITSVGTLTDLTVSGTSTTIGTVTSGIWNAGAVTSSGAVTGASLVADLTTLDSNTLSTSSGNLTLSAATGADVLIGDNATILYVDGGTNGLGIGVAAQANYKVTIGGAHTGGSNSYGFRVEPSVTGVVNNNFAIMSIKGTLIEAGSGTHAGAVGLWLEPPTITGGSAAVTSAATLKIDDAPAASGANNYALWVAAGESKFGGVITAADLTVSGTSTTIGTVTSGIWNAGAVTSSGGISGTTGTFTSTFKIVTGAGGADPHASYNDIWIDGDTNAGITISSSGANGYSAIQFGDDGVSSDFGFGVAFGSSGEKFYWNSAGGRSMELSGGGTAALSLKGAPTISNTSGALTIDAVTDINLDADNYGYVAIKDAGTELFTLYGDSSLNYYLRQNIYDKSLFFRVNTGTSGSASWLNAVEIQGTNGAVIFNGSWIAGGTSNGYLRMYGDSGSSNYMQWSDAGVLLFATATTINTAAGDLTIDAAGGEIRIGSAVNVDFQQNGAYNIGGTGNNWVNGGITIATGGGLTFNGISGNIVTTGTSDLKLDAGRAIGIRAAANSRYAVAIGGAGDDAYASTASSSSETAYVLIRPASVTHASGTGNLWVLNVNGATLTPTGSTGSAATMRVSASTKGGGQSIADMAAVWIVDEPTGGASSNYSLRVDGTTRIYRNLASGSTSQALLRLIQDHASDDQATLYASNDGSGYTFQFDSGGAWRSYQTSSGAMYVRPSGDQTVIHATGSNGNTAVALGSTNSDEGYIDMFDGNTRKVRIAANLDSFFNGGNVGIGPDTSPNYLLDVQGTFPC